MTKRVQIAVGLGAEIADLIIRYNRILRKKFQSEFIIDNRQFFAHITIYAPEFPEINIVKIVDTCRYAIKELGIKSFEISPDKLFSDNGFIMLDLKDDKKQLRKLHENIVLATNDLRAGVVRSKYLDTEFMDSLTDKNRKLIEEYGYQFVFEYYHPHISFAYFESEIMAQKAFDYLLSESDFYVELTKTKIQIDNVTLFDSCEYAHCSKEIARISFG